MQPYERLEARWAEFNELDPAGMVACSSGTAALHLALEVNQPKFRNLWCALPTYTMIACARAASLAGYVQEFSDCREDLLTDLCIGASDVAMVVHVNGRQAPIPNKDRTRILGLKYVVEDLAEAHGIRPSPETDAACWSFYANKVVAGEEGGAVWFRDPARAKLARMLRCQGFTEAHDYTHVPRGHNYRLANSLAKLVLKSLERYNENLDARRWLESKYAQAMDEVLPKEFRLPKRSVPWVYDLRLKGYGGKQEAVVRELQREGIMARFGFKPVTSQEEYRNCGSQFMVAELLATEVISLPLHPEMVGLKQAQPAAKIIAGVLGL